MTTEVGRRRLHVPDTLARAVLTILLLGLIGWVLLANVGNLEEVGQALGSVSAGSAALLLGLFLVTQSFVAAQLAITIPGLGMRRAAVAVEGAAAVSNTVPGPSGTATRLAMLRSWGYLTDDFARSWLFTSSLTNLVVLVMPVVAVVIAAAQWDLSAGVVILAVIGLVVSIVGVILVWLMLRSEAFSLRVGALTGRVVRWARGIAHRRPSEKDFAEAAVRFRDGLTETWTHSGGRLVAAVLAVYLLNGLMLGVSMRAVGLDAAVLPIGASAVVYAFVRLATIVNFTPGGVGVVEALYTAAFVAVAPDANQSVIVAGVILFRGVTYAGPIVLGVAALLIWRLRRSWRRAPVPEPVASAAIGAALTDREMPGEDSPG
jgi:uncharacterized protein (TIRG00374 family)